MEKQTKIKVITTRRIKKIVSCRYAVSPIFATLIILAIVTVLFIPIFIWATSTTSEKQDSWQLSGLIATERIVIEEVSLSLVTNDCKVYVRNIGETAISIEHIIISLFDGTDPIIYSKSGTPNIITTNYDSVIKGDLITIEFTFTPLQQTYTVKAITSRGIADEFQVVVE